MPSQKTNQLLDWVIKTDINAIQNTDIHSKQFQKELYQINN